MTCSTPCRSRSALLKRYCCGQALAAIVKASGTSECQRYNSALTRFFRKLLEWRGHKGWDDDRPFETARLINIRQILAVVVNDYIRQRGSDSLQSR